MSSRPAKALEHSSEFTRSIHHIVDHRHCETILKAKCETLSKCAQVTLDSQVLSSSAKAVNILGRAICECDDAIASGISSGVNLAAEKLIPMAAETIAKNTKLFVKCTGPLTVGIGMAFVINDVCRAPEHKKVETFGRGSAKLALTTGTTVLGTLLAGPVGAVSLGFVGGLLGDFLDRATGGGH